MDNIFSLCNLVSKTGKLSKDYALVFVYNNADNIDDQIHASECISTIERDMIIGAFRRSLQYVYAVSSEQEFLARIEKIKEKHKYTCVYSMAQNIPGTGRRSLIPLLCTLYNVINIGSGFLPSTLSGCKTLMNILQNDKSELYFPKTIYIKKHTDLLAAIKDLSTGRYLIKPDDESASIGVEDIIISPGCLDDVLKKLSEYRTLYPNFLIQEFITGTEVEVALLYYNNEFYCPGVCEIVMNDETEYLNYDVVQTDDYDFQEYSCVLTEKIIQMSKQVADGLGFYTISRIDFRICNNIPYIIDIGANPTISYHSSTNYMFRKRFGDEHAVYRLLLFKALIENGVLFKPPLH